MMLFCALIILIQCVYAERISSKLDFGDPSVGSHAAISVNHNRGISNPYINNPEFISTVREFPCSSNDCKNSETASAAADVVVHVKTHVNVPNGTRFENVPDVPIIVGSKDLPSYDPIGPDPNFAPHFYPSYGTPDVGFNVINRHPVVQTGRGFNNYPVNNGIPFNNHPNRHVPELQWYPQGNIQNPLEFRKIFKNSWTSSYPIDWSGYTNKRHTQPNEWAKYSQTTGIGLDELLSKWGSLLSLEMNKYLHSK